MKEVKVGLSVNQADGVRKAQKAMRGVVVRLSKGSVNGNHSVMVTDSDAAKLARARKAGTGSQIEVLPKAAEGGNLILGALTADEAIRLVHEKKERKKAKKHGQNVGNKIKHLFGGNLGTVSETRAQGGALGTLAHQKQIENGDGLFDKKKKKVELLTASSNNGGSKSIDSNNKGAFKNVTVKTGKYKKKA